MTPSEVRTAGKQGSVMFKRLFWIGVGVTVGALAVIKARPTSRPTPLTPHELRVRPGSGPCGHEDAGRLVNEFNATRRAREAELNQHYIDRAAR